MLNLANTASARPCCDWLPWAGLVAGVVLNKDGSFQRTARFRGPDLDSATQRRADRHVGAAEQRPAPHGIRAGRCSSKPSAGLRPIIRTRTFPSRFRGWWRKNAGPPSRNRAITSSGYHLTLLYLPPEESRARAAKMLYENTPTNGVDWRERLQAFVAETDRVFDLFDGVMPEIDWLDDAQTLTYLHTTISTRRYSLAVPEVPFHIDALLTDSALVGGLACWATSTCAWCRCGASRPRPGRGFWTTSTASVCVPLEHALSLPRQSRGGKTFRLRRQWFAKRKNVIALLRETIFQQESPLVDTDANNKAADADAALQELGSDQVAFGYLTATVTVMDEDAAVADEAAHGGARHPGPGLRHHPETLNAVDAWLSSLPGNAYANVRQPIVSTLNWRT